MAGGSFDFLRCCCLGQSPLRGLSLVAPSRKSKSLTSRGRRIRGRVLGQDFDKLTDKVWMRAAAAQVSSAELELDSLQVVTNPKQTVASRNELSLAIFKTKSPSRRILDDKIIRG